MIAYSEGMLHLLHGFCTADESKKTEQTNCPEPEKKQQIRTDAKIVRKMDMVSPVNHF